MSKEIEVKDPEVEMTEEQPVDDASVTDVQAELERTRKALAKANQEAAARRKQIEAYEAETLARVEAEMSELEKARAATTKAEAERQVALQQASEMVLRSSIIAKAASLNFADPEDAYALLDKSDLVVEEGKVAGLDEALKSLADSKQYMIRVDKPKLGASNPGSAAYPAGEGEAERRRRLGLA